MGGEGGGEMKKSFSLLGACRCWSPCSILVSAPKYTRTRLPSTVSPSSTCRMLVASEALWKVQIILRMDLRGAKVWMVACSLMAREMDSRLEEVKISGAWRLVMRRVLLGGEGWLKAGRSERSRERLGERRLAPVGGEADVEVGGVDRSIAIVVISSDKLVDFRFVMDVVVDVERMEGREGWEVE